MQVGPGGSLVSPSTLPAGGLFNYAALNYFQRPDDRYTGGAFAHYDVNDHAQGVHGIPVHGRPHLLPDCAQRRFHGLGSRARPMAFRTALGRSIAATRTSPRRSTARFGCTGPAATNPNIVDITFGRRNVEGGDRTDDLGHTSYRTVLGVKGDINDAWNYDTYFQNGVTRFSEDIH